MMSLIDYFENTRGLGVLATADINGNVDVALYARPHIIDEENIAFIMSDRLSHKNLSSNPKCAYLLIEEGQGYKGKRLCLIKTDEETDPEKIESLRRKKFEYSDPSAIKYLVTFRIDKIRPLVGDAED
ncbi:MAG: pyridoxamine 5'-phosphate oxidase family protein [Planctomycetota bacterium]|jgi:hypothetical protein